VDKTKIIELYRKTPTGELLHDTSLPPRSLLIRTSPCVWETTRKSHAPPARFDGDNQNQQSHSAEEGGNAENKTILLTNGIVANWCLLLNDTKTTQPTPHTRGRMTPPLFPILNIDIEYLPPAGTHRSIDRERRRSRQSQKRTYRPSIGK